MLQLKWKKCGDDNHWCSLKLLKLETANADGVYVIWHEGNEDVPPRTVKVGQGDVPDRLGKHRKDARITAYEKYGALRVTWAAVPAEQKDGVERYLADLLNPLVGDAYPDVEPIPVNSPFA